METLFKGHYVLVMPGGDVDAGKRFRRRDEILFAGRTGFARVALDADVLIIPNVISGAGETLLVLWDGQPFGKSFFDCPSVSIQSSLEEMKLQSRSPHGYKKRCRPSSTSGIIRWAIQDSNLEPMD